MTRRRIAACAGLAALLAAACGSDPPPARTGAGGAAVAPAAPEATLPTAAPTMERATPTPRERPAPEDPSSQPTVSNRTTTATASPTASPTASSTASSSASPTASRTPAAAPFAGAIGPIDGALRARIERTSWRPGCPVGLDDLRHLTVAYWDFDGARVEGELIVAAAWAEPLLDVFRRLYDARYPIERVALVDAYGGDDGASMRANNTSGFNCREVAGRPGVWSNHAYGTAIDLNPLVNPYVSGSFVDPPEGAAYADRTNTVPGMIQPGDAAVEAFASIGWIWGGTWSSTKDYQHFSANGR